MDNKINLRRLFAESPLCMTGIVICIAVAIFLAVMLISGSYKKTATVEMISPATQISQQSSKEGAYKMLFGSIEMAESKIVYNEKLEWYSLTLLSYGSLVFQKIISCADPEMPKLEAAMRALEAHLLILHKEDASAKNSPASFNSCALMNINFKTAPKKQTSDDWGRNRRSDLEYDWLINGELNRKLNKY